VNGTEIRAYLGNKYSAAREAKILEMVRQGHYLLNWVPIHIDMGPRRATLFTSNDAIRLGDVSNSFRPGMTQRTEQQIADELNAVLGTPKLSDETYRQAQIRPKPCLHYGGPHMADTDTMIKHSAAVDAQVGPLIQDLYGPEVDPRELLIAPVGKDWSNSRRLIGSPMVHGQPAAINYGGHRQDMGPIPKTGPFPSATMYPPVVVHQSEGRAHSYGHTDYSQGGRFYMRLVEICEPAPLSGMGRMGCQAGVSCRLPDGTTGQSRCVDIYDVAQDAELWPLVSHNGPVYMRHFAVPWEKPQGTGAGHSIWQGFSVTPPPKSLVEPGGPVGPPVEVPPEPSGISLAQRLGVFGASLATSWFGTKWITSRR